MNLESSVNSIKGIGAEREKYLRKLNIVTVGDIIEHYPRDYEDRTVVTPISELCPDENAVILAYAKEEPKNSHFGGMTITKVRVYDESGSIGIVWYNQPYARNNIKVGVLYAFIGKMTVTKNNRREINSPEVEKIDENGSYEGKIVPVYSLCAGLNQKVFRKTVIEALNKTEDSIADCLPFFIRKKYKLAEKKFAVKNIHIPENKECYVLARERLVFEELFTLQVALLQIKNETVADRSGQIMEKVDMAEFF